MVFKYCALVAVTFVLAMASSPGSTLIPLSDHFYEHTYDPFRNLLYVPTYDGKIARYDLANQQLLQPFVTGGYLLGSDITVDGRYLYVADYEERNDTSFLYKVDLDTGDSVTITQEAPRHISGLSDITILNNGTAIVVGQTTWSPSDRQIMALDLTTDNWTTATESGVIRRLPGPSRAARSADRSFGAFVGYGTSASAVLRYDAATSSFVNDGYIGGWYDLVTVNRDGTLLAVDREVYRPDATLVHEFQVGPRTIGGLAFDPLQDVLYMADRTSDTVVAYDSETWEELGEIPIGEDIGLSRIAPERNHMSTSDDGKLLFVTTASGVRVLENSFAVPEPTGCVICAIAACILITYRHTSSRSQSANPG